MTIEVFEMTRCPICAEESPDSPVGTIVFDLPAARQLQTGSDGIEDMNKFVRFNSASEQQEPCDHLLYGFCHLDSPSDPIEGNEWVELVDGDWWAPELPREDASFIIEVLSVPSRTSDFPALASLLVEPCFFEHQWAEQNDHGGTNMMYSVGGFACFTYDRSRFLVELEKCLQPSH